MKKISIKKNLLLKNRISLFKILLKRETFLEYLDNSEYGWTVNNGSDVDKSLMSMIFVHENYYESGENKLILSFVINSILKNKDKSLKEKFTKWLIDVANINKDLTKIGNTIQTQSFTSVSTLDCLYNLVLELFMNAGKKLEQYIDLSYIRYDNCPLFIGNDERLDTSFELIQYEQDDENVTTKPSFLTIFILDNFSLYLEESSFFLSTLEYK